MADNVLTLLYQQRIMAAEELITSVPIGSYFEYSGVLYTITGWDKKTGFIDLTNVADPSNKALNVTADPLSILYPNATAASSATGSTGGTTPAPTGQSSLQSLMSLGQMGLSAWQASGQQSLLKKGASQSMGQAIDKVGTGTGGLGTGPGGTIDISQITSLSSAQQAVTQAKAALDAAKQNVQLAMSAPGNLASAQDQLAKAEAAAAKADTDLSKAYDACYGPNASANVTQLADQLKNDFKVNQVDAAYAKTDTDYENMEAAPDGSATQQYWQDKWIMDENAYLSLNHQWQTTDFTQQARDTLTGNITKADTDYLSADATVQADQGAVNAANAAPQNASGYLAQTQAAQAAAQTQLQQAQAAALAWKNVAQSAGDVKFNSATNSYESSNKVCAVTDDEITAATIQAGPHATGAQIASIIDQNRAAALLTTTPADLQAAASSLNAQVVASDYLQKAGFDPVFVGSLTDSERMQMATDVGTSGIDVNGAPIAPPSWLTTTSPAVIQENAQSKVMLAQNNAQLFDNSALKKDDIMAAGAIIGGAVAGFEEFNAFSGPLTFKNILKGVGSIVGMMVAMHTLNSALSNGLIISKQLDSFLGKNMGDALGGALKWMSSGTGSMVTAGVIALAAILTRVLGSKKTPAETQAAEQLNAEVLPTVSAQGGVFQLSNIAGAVTTAGVTLASLGITLGPSAPGMQTLTIPQTEVTAALTAASPNGMPTAANRYSALFYLPSQSGQPTEIAYITPAGTAANGMTMETLHFETLSSQYTIAATQNPTAYIPFFLQNADGSYSENSQLLANQVQLLQCADGTQVADAQSCLNHGGVLSHTGSGG